MSEWIDTEVSQNRISLVDAQHDIEDQINASIDQLVIMTTTDIEVAKIQNRITVYKEVLNKFKSLA